MANAVSSMYKDAKTLLSHVNDLAHQNAALLFSRYGIAITLAGASSLLPGCEQPDAGKEPVKQEEIVKQEKYLVEHVKSGTIDYTGINPNFTIGKLTTVGATSDMTCTTGDALGVAVTVEFPLNKDGKPNVQVLEATAKRKACIVGIGKDPSPAMFVKPVNPQERLFTTQKALVTGGVLLMSEKDTITANIPLNAMTKHEAKFQGAVRNTAGFVYSDGSIARIHAQFQLNGIEPSLENPTATQARLLGR